MTEEHLGYRHFSLVEVHDGVHAAIARDGGWAVGNAGIVDLGGRILVFDSFVNQNVAAELKVVAEERLRGRVEFVVNSHRHGDHVKGNQAFKGARIVATTKTRDAMAKLKSTSYSPPDELRRSYEEELSKVLSDPTSPDFELDEGYMRGHLDGLPTLEFTLPDLTFESSLRVHGDTRTAEIVSFGGGHTESDSLLYLPEDGVAFLGDL
jgi:cyclase